jgi:hypothetical protein
LKSTFSWMTHVSMLISFTYWFISSILAHTGSLIFNVSLLHFLACIICYLETIVPVSPLIFNTLLPESGQISDQPSHSLKYLSYYYEHVFSDFPKQKSLRAHYLDGYTV